MNKPDDDPLNKLPLMMSETLDEFIERRKKEPTGYGNYGGGRMLEGVRNLTYEFPLGMWRFINLDSKLLTEKDYEESFNFLKRSFEKAKKTYRIAIFERNIYDRTQKPKEND